MNGDGHFWPTRNALARRNPHALSCARGARFIPVPFDRKVVFGKVRAPVLVTLNGHTYRSTIASMGEGPCLPLRKSNREAAQLEGNETLRVTLELDED